jgi:hypothetical protein
VPVPTVEVAPELSASISFANRPSVAPPGLTVTNTSPQPLPKPVAHPFGLPLGTSRWNGCRSRLVPPALPTEIAAPEIVCAEPDEAAKALNGAGYGLARPPVLVATMLSSPMPGPIE